MIPKCTSAFVIIFLIALQTCNVELAAVMSVDLGSEWMKVGVISPGFPMEIALNQESKRKTPTYIGFKDGERLFGDEAITLSMRYPSRSFGYLTDLIGKTIDNPVVELYKKRFPYHTIEKDEERGTIVFRDGDEIFSVEELIAQILEKAKEFAQDYTGQQISEAVITVPGFFGQAERNCLIQAAKLIDLKILQLMNDYTAVALNYGIFRRKEINETSQYYVFYDIGAYKATATVVSYQLVRDKVLKETVPALQILGVGYDRTIGGLEMQLRLRDHLAKKFNELKKTQTDVFTNARAMAKLFKEAGRVKNILSANTEIYAQIEGLLEEHDFKAQVTRDDFENMCKDIFEKVPQVLNRALAMAELNIDIISQVVLFGGSTRVPKIQDILKKAINKELSKNLNSDEAAALGAVYRAADLTTGFKVKKFITKDAVLYPIQVVFEREGESGTVRQVRRTLFKRMDSYPQKKVMTFSKHQSDFSFNVNHAELEHLDTDELNKIGTLNLSTIHLSNVAEALEKHTGENVESKGVKAHFVFDESGIFKLLNTEFIFEKLVTEEKDENTFQKISSTISKLFSTDQADGGEIVDNQSKNETETKQEEGDETKGNKTDTVVENDSSKNSTAKTKVVIVKEELPREITTMYTRPLDGDKFKESLKRVSDIQIKELNQKRKETALNALESFVIDAQMRLEQEEYIRCAMEGEVEKILKTCSEVSEWIYEDGSDADAELYEKRLNELKGAINDIYAKHWEHKERPEALNALKSMINGSEGFLATARNLTKETNPEKAVFSQTEIDNLEKAIKETIKWRDTEVEEQDKLSHNEPIRLTVSSITDKMSYLDREVKYLVNKIKAWRPKVPPVKETSNDSNQTEENTNHSGEHSQDKVADDSTTSSETPVSEMKENNTDTEEKPHEEL